MTEQKSNDSARFILSITLKLFIISTITALLLAGVNALTAERIAENSRAEKAAAISAIFPDATENEESDKTADGVQMLYLVKSGDDVIGYAASVAPNGFGGALDVMVGVNADGTVAGVKIVSHGETPGLGSRVNDDGYLSQYVGKSGSLAIGSNIDAITGSTISSKAVLAGVNAALGAYPVLFGENGGAQ